MGAAPGLFARRALDRVLAVEAGPVATVDGELVGAGLEDLTVVLDVLLEDDGLGAVEHVVADGGVLEHQLAGGVDQRVVGVEVGLVDREGPLVDEQGADRVGSLGGATVDQLAVLVVGELDVLGGVDGVERAETLVGLLHVDDPDGHDDQGQCHHAEGDEAGHVLHHTAFLLRLGTRGWSVGFASGCTETDLGVWRRSRTARFLAHVACRLGPDRHCPDRTCSGLEGDQSTSSGCGTRRVRWNGRAKTTPASSSHPANAYSDGAQVAGTSSPTATMTPVTALNWPSVE